MSRRYCFNTLSSLLIVASATTVNAYNAEWGINLGASATHTETELDMDGTLESFSFDTETDIDTSYAATGLTVFFRDISPQPGPWQEAAFLSKTGSINLGMGRLETEAQSEDNAWLPTKWTEYELSNNLIAVRARMIFGPVIVEPAYLSVEDEYEFGGVWEEEQKTRDVQLGIGGYIGNFQEVVASIGKTRITQNTAADSEQPHIGLRYKAVFPIGKTARVHIAPYANYEFSELSIDNEDIGDIQTSIIGVTIYPRQDLGIGPEIRSLTRHTKESTHGYLQSSEEEYTSSTATIAVNLSYMPLETLLLNFRLSAIGEYEEYSAEYVAGPDWEEVEMETSGGGLGLDTSLTFRF